MPEPLVSVAVVSYNHAAFIAACLESLFSQDYPNLEFILADDASADATVARARAAARKAKRTLKVLTTPRNLGITGNVNRALAACTGTYVVLIGGDDLAYPGKVRAQVDALEARPDAGLCHHDVDVFFTDPAKDGVPFSRQVPPRGTRAADLVRHGNFVAAPSVMVRRAFLPPALPDEVPRSSDWVMNLEAARRGPLLYLPRALGAYRKHPQSVTGSGRTRHDEFLTLGYLEATMPEFLREVRWRRAHLLAARGRLAGDAGDGRAAVAYARAALGLRRRWPPRQLLWLLVAASGLRRRAWTRRAAGSAQAREE
ncbi:MAG TPA: glycosyltransferase [Candidatus Thermoplasmatota archaeon]|nr:glycosyltransferase [Candidatus Thermoplasmatota archaeon]